MATILEGLYQPGPGLREKQFDVPVRGGQTSTPKRGLSMSPRACRQLGECFLQITVMRAPFDVIDRQTSLSSVLVM